MANVYQKGDEVRLAGTFTDSASAAYDPTTVIGRVKNPGDTITSYTYGVDAQMIRQATGVYYFDVHLDTVGQWWWRMESHQGDAAAEDYIIVRRTEF
jgi:hypothetical protein